MASGGGGDGTGGGGGGGSNWRRPNQTQMQKYGLNPLPDDFEPTEEEKILLDMYETVRGYERQAARLKEMAAREKLEKRDLEFQRRLAPASGENKKKNKRKRNKREVVEEGVASGDDLEDDSELDSDSDDKEDDSDDDDGEEAEARHERNEAKIAALRKKVEEAKHAQESKEDALIEQHLSTTDTDMVGGPVLKKKPRVETFDQGSSLIANLKRAETPPHDFSEKLGLTRGKVLFPRYTDESPWSPPPRGAVSHPNEEAFVVELEDFDVSRAQTGAGNNTVAIKFMAPSDSKRFSINIAAPDHDEFDSVLFHFNPRQRERGGQLVVNNKEEGTWGQAVAIPLSQIPLVFGQTSVTLLIQINGEGFDIFLENQHCARLEHRRALPPGNNDLVLQFPSTDDSLKAENWTVYKVWWGNRPLMTKGDLSGIPGVNSYNSLHPRKLFVGGLTKVHRESDVDVRRAELERAFRKYGGDRGVQVIVPTNATYAFVEMESERQTDLALTEMSGQYRMNRARRSRHEALQEERAAKEAAKPGGKKKEGTEWD